MESNNIPKRYLSEREIEAKRSKRGGYSRKQLAEWGVPWPPPKGWKQALMGDPYDLAEQKTMRSRYFRQIALDKFAREHDVGCFKCGSKTSEWAKSGINGKYGAWIICLPCVQKGKERR